MIDTNLQDELQETLQEKTETPAPQPAAEPTKEYNFRALREEKERLQRERDEYYTKMREYESRQQPAAKQQEEIELGDDELIEAKHLKKALKNIRTEFEQYKQQTTQISAEQRVRSKYPDFEKVVSEANVNQLKEEYPEVYETLRSNDNLEMKAASAYTLIKKLGISKDEAFEPDKQKAQQNLSKPKPVNAIAQGDSPMSRANAFANGLTDDLKKSLYAEMMEARKNY